MTNTMNDQAKADKIATTIGNLLIQYPALNVPMLAIGLGADQCYANQYGYVMVVGSTAKSI